MIRLSDRCPNTTLNRLSLAKWTVAATGQSKALCKAPVTIGPWLTDTVKRDQGSWISLHMRPMNKSEKRQLQNLPPFHHDHAIVVLGLQPCAMSLETKNAKVKGLLPVSLSPTLHLEEELTERPCSVQVAQSR